MPRSYSQLESLKVKRGHLRSKIPGQISVSLKIGELYAKITPSTSPL